MESRSNPPVQGKVSSNQEDGKPETAPAPGDTPSKGAPSAEKYFNYISAAELSASILSYAERTCPGVSSRLNAGDFVALQSGLIHASGLGASIRKVSICPPMDYLSPLFGASREYSPRTNKVAGQAVRPARGKEKTNTKSSLKSSNTGTGPSAKGVSPSGVAKGQVKPTRKSKAAPPPLSGVAKLRRSLKKAALSSLKRLKRDVKEVDWSKESGGLENMRCAAVLDLTPEIVRSAVDKLSDDEINRRDFAIPTLVFLGFIPKESMEGELLIARAASRQPKPSASASEVKEAKEKPTGVIKPTKTHISSSGTVVPEKSFARAVSPVPVLPAASRVAVRSLRPGHADPQAPLHERISSVLKGIAIDLRPGIPCAPSGDDEDLLGEFLDMYNSPKPAWNRVTASGTGSPFVSVTSKGRILSFFVINRVGTPHWAIVISNGAHPDIPQTVLQFPEFADWRSSRSLCNIFPVVSPPRQEALSTSRRPSISRSVVAPSVGERRESEDVFSDLYTLAKR